jgi:hypothetical protein
MAMGERARWVTLRDHVLSYYVQYSSAYNNVLTWHE